LLDYSLEHMIKTGKIGHRPAGGGLAHSPPGDARFRGMGVIMPESENNLTNMREPWLRRSCNQPSMKQAEGRLPVESRGWLAGECDSSFHPDKPSLIRLSPEMGGGVNELRRVSASGEVKAFAVTVSGRPNKPLSPTCYYRPVDKLRGESESWPVSGLALVA
jgi:hypothetical protein